MVLNKPLSSDARHRIRLSDATSQYYIYRSHLHAKFQALLISVPSFSYCNRSSLPIVIYFKLLPINYVLSGVFLLSLLQVFFLLEFIFKFVSL
jgi:hypothetical protein